MSNVVTVNKSHGSPFDRGAADSYYSRAMKPHKKNSMTRIDDISPEEIEEYRQGYEYNQESGDHKEWY